MDQNTPDPSIAMVAVFRARANRLRILAYGILTVIFFLLTGGAAAFVLAPQITLSDFGLHADVNGKIAELDALITQMRQADEKQRAAWIESTGKALEILAPIIKKYAKPDSQFDVSDVTISYTNIDKTQEIAKEIARISQTKSDIALRLDFPGSAIDVFPGGVYRIPKNTLKKFISELSAISLQKISPYNRIDTPRANPESEKFRLLLEARNLLAKKKDQLDIESIIGSKLLSKNDENNATEKNATPNGVTEISTAQLIQTNLTRFGTIILIALLVGILTPLYRYNVRLATYYDARADVMELFSGKLKSVGFSTLITSLTPTFDFSKAPATPIEQVVEAIQIIRGAKTPKDGNE